MEQALPRPGLRGISLNPSLPCPRGPGDGDWGQTGGHGRRPQAASHGTPGDAGSAVPPLQPTPPGATVPPLRSCCSSVPKAGEVPEEPKSPFLGLRPGWGPARGCAGGPCQGPGRDRGCGPALPRCQSRAGLTGSGQTERERPPAAQECTALISGSLRAWGGNSSPEFAFLSLLLTPALPWVEPRSPGSQVNQVAGTSK